MEGLFVASTANEVRPWKALLKDTTLYGEEELQDAMNAVLEAGEAIIRCANEKKEVVNG